MKAVFIVYNQAHTEKIEYMLVRLEMRGFTQWGNVSGRGSVNGELHLGPHTWLEMNSATLTMVEDDKVDIILEKVRKLNSINEEVGIRAFVWDISQTV